MATDPGVPTVMNINQAKAALKTFTDLQTAIGNAQNADGVAAIPNTLDLSSVLGNLIDNAGQKVNGYYQTRANAVQSAIQACTSGVDGIVTMLNESIAQYQQHETSTATSASQTGTGSTSSSSTTASSTSTSSSGGMN